MRNGVQRIDTHDLLSADDACSLFGLPGCVTSFLPCFDQLRCLTKDAVSMLGMELPDDCKVYACARAIDDETFEVVAYCRI
jgi:hypothetical protein